TLQALARCLRNGGQPAAAEKHLREALVVIDALIKQQSDNRNRIRQRAMLLTDLGDALTDQGRYLQAQEAYEGVVKVAKQQDDLRAQAVALTQLGTLALQQRQYAEARTRYSEALKNFRALGEPAMEAVAWHQLGRVAEEQKEWAEAERCYRESLALEE